MHCLWYIPSAYLSLFLFPSLLRSLFHHHSFTWFFRATVSITIDLSLRLVSWYDVSICSKVTLRGPRQRKPNHIIRVCTLCWYNSALYNDVISKLIKYPKSHRTRASPLTPHSRDIPCTCLWYAFLVPDLLLVVTINTYAIDYRVDSLSACSSSFRTALSGTSSVGTSVATRSLFECRWWCSLSVCFRCILGHDRH
jgi:hypothetical protein